ncbi:MAG: hypothetical protein OXH70_17710 [Acidobacteria bacterium]|nr:hypothetical protein [Acidobacteriota bacterium]
MTTTYRIDAVSDDGHDVPRCEEIYGPDDLDATYATHGVMPSDGAVVSVESDERECV